MKKLTCPFCGKPFFLYTMPSDKNICPTCDGSGKVEIRSSLSDKVRRT